MRLMPGDKIIDISLPTLEGGEFQLSSYTEKEFMITFFRFASCPFCNLRIQELIKLHHESGGRFRHVAIFESPLERMQRHSKRLTSPFPVLSDSERVYFEKYGVERSTLGMVKGMTIHLPTILRGMIKGYIPTEVSSRYLTMPANFLVDSTGIIQKAYYGSHEGDHIPLKEVKTFFSIDD